MQRADQAGRIECRVEAIGVFQRVAIHADDRVNRRTFFVVSFDAAQIHFNQLTARQLTGLISGMNLFDGGFDDIKAHMSVPFERFQRERIMKPNLLAA